MSEISLLKVGSDAPAFALPGSADKTLSLKDFEGNPLVLYFYPKADTPGCTTQACAFRDAAADYAKAGVAVLGVSPDKVEAVKKFAAKFHLNFPLLADPEHDLCEKYGVWQQKSMMGRKYMGVVRTTFVIDAAGKIARIFEKVKPEGHDREVLQWIGGNLK